jgi:hypothetical protein
LILGNALGPVVDDLGHILVLVHIGERLCAGGRQIYSPW